MANDQSGIGQPEREEHKCSICHRLYTSKALLAAHFSRSHRTVRSGVVNRNASVTRNQTQHHAQSQRTGSASAPLYRRRSLQDLYAPNHTQTEEPAPHPGTENEIHHSIHTPHVPTSSNFSPSEENVFPVWQTPSEIVEPTRGSTEVAELVTQFFRSYGDTSKPLFESCKQPEPPLENLNPTCQTVISACTTRQLTLGEVREEWQMLSSVESHISPGERHVTNTFSTADQFARYIDNLRRWTVRNEGWRKACIKTESGVNETGVFRPGLQLLLNELEAAGGVENIQPSSEQLSENDRVFSAPWNADAMKQFEMVKEKQGCGDAKTVALDIYCDGTSVARSGSQSAHTLRLRFPTLKGRSSKWHEVVLTPSLVPRDDRRPRKKGESRRQRIELFHRFLFLALEDLIKISSTGLLHKGTLIIPRLLMVVADQPQEREFVSLKGADSYRDCTQCIMLSREKDEIERRRPASEQSPSDDRRPTKRVRTINMSGSTEIAENSDGHSVVSDVDSALTSVTTNAAQTETSTANTVQLNPNGAAPRDVPRTVLLN